MNPTPNQDPTGNPDFDALAAQVAATRDVEQSAVTLLTSLGDKIRQNANDPAALHRLADGLRDSADALAKAITANTPADPTDSRALLKAQQAQQGGTTGRGGKGGHGGRSKP